MGLVFFGMGGIIAVALFFLSVWIVVPASNFRLLPLSVGAPEISPLLLLLSAMLLLLVLLSAGLNTELIGGGLGPKRKATLWIRSVRYGLLLLLLITVVLSSQPLIQQPRAVAMANRSMVETFGKTTVSTPTPAFSLLTFFDGFLGARRLYSSEVRHQPKIPFTTPSDPEALFLDVYQPPEEGQYPAVVMIYGGGWSTGSSSENEAFGRFLASQGYVAVAVDYRHTPDYRFPAQLIDVKKSLEFVRSHAKDYGIISDRISLMGWSAGAQLAMLAGFQATQPIQSIINFYGPVDLARGYAEPPQPDPLNVRQVLLAYLGGPPEENSDAYADASPITFVKSAQPDSLPPVLLIYGGRDNIVEQRFGKALHQQLLQSGNKGVWVAIPWAEHAFDKVFSGVSNQMSLHFIQQFLKETL